MSIPAFHPDGRTARLDEKSARRIAAGRLNALRERIDATVIGSRGESSKPDVRARAIQETVERAFGQSLLAWGRTGRILFHEVALPGEKPGWVDIVVFRHNLRSATTSAVLLAQLSAHATARLLQRRRGVDIERLLAEELEGTPLKRLIDAWTDKKPSGISLATKNGDFRLRRDDEGALIAVTWVPRKPA